MSTIFHLDLDAFFVSVERILTPSLNGKPVIVGGDPEGRGVVAACSYEARDYGLRSGMPIKQAFKLCPHGIYLHGHGEEYVRYSNLVESILVDYAPLIEKASIDEFYIDFSGCKKIYGSSIQLAEKIQKEVWKTLNLPCSIGIASNKTIAKIASDFHKPKGITHVINGMEKEFLANLPVETLPGVGIVMLKNLNSRGIYFVKDITALTQDYFSAVYGKVGIDLWNKANGRGREFLSIEHKRKSISKETTFEKDITSKEELEIILFQLAGKVAHSLRKKGWVAATVNLKLRYTDFTTLTRSKTIDFTDDDKTIYDTAVKLFRNAYTRRVAVRLIGVGVTNFTKYSEQELLFDDYEIKRKRMLRAVNIIRSKYNYNAILIGCSNMNVLH